MNRSGLQFLAGNKNAGFQPEKKRRNSQNFSAKMLEKLSHFFALIGNTDQTNDTKTLKKCGCQNIKLNSIILF